MTRRGKGVNDKRLEILKWLSELPVLERAVDDSGDDVVDAWTLSDRSG